jgi:hypothetical protein
VCCPHHTYLYTHTDAQHPQARTRAYTHDCVGLSDLVMRTGCSAAAAAAVHACAPPCVVARGTVRQEIRCHSRAARRPRAMYGATIHPHLTRTHTLTLSLSLCFSIYHSLYMCRCADGRACVSADCLGRPQCVRTATVRRRPSGACCRRPWTRPKCHVIAKSCARRSAASSSSCLNIPS